MQGDSTTRAFRVLLAVAAIASIAPLFCSRHLPMVDLPEHVATMATLRHWWDPAWGGREHFQLAGWSQTPYWLYHVVGAALSLVTRSAERANLFLLAIVGLAYPYALRSLLRALGRDERLALFGCALFWSQNLTFGLLNFVAAVPLVLYGVARAVEHAGTPVRRRGLALALVAVAILYLHLIPFAIFVAASALVTMMFPVPHGTAMRPFAMRAFVLARLRTSPRRLVWLVPSFVCASVVLLAGRAGAGATGERGVFFTPRWQLLETLPHWLFDTFRSKVDDMLGWLLIACLAFLVGASRRAKTFDERWRSICGVALFALAVLFYFVMPARVGAYAFLLDVRTGIFVALFAVLVPVPRSDFRGSMPLAFAGALSIGLALNAAYEVRAFARDEVGAFDELLRRLPHGKRLVSLNFEPRSHRVNSNPFQYFGSYYRARYGGVASFSFTETPHWPVQYRATARPPGVPGTWGNPCVYRNARDGRYFDYLLVHGERDPIAEGPAGPAWELIGSSRAFHLYRRLDVELPGEEDEASLCL